MNDIDARALQLRDKEIMTFFFSLSNCTNQAAYSETAKVMDCSLIRVNEAMVRISENKAHLYWK